MIRITGIFYLAITLLASCSFDKKENKEEYYQILNTVLNYHEDLIGIGEKFSFENDSTGGEVLFIRYSKFKVYPRTSNIAKVTRSDNKLTFSIQKVIDPTFSFEDLFAISDSSSIKKQFEDIVKLKLDSNKLSHALLPLDYQMIENLTPVKIDSLTKEFETDIIFVDSPVFSGTHKEAVVSCTYFEGLSCISKLIKLEKDSQNVWKVSKELGVAFKYLELSLNSEIKLQVVGSMKRDVADVYNLIN